MGRQPRRPGAREGRPRGGAGPRVPRRISSLAFPPPWMEPPGKWPRALVLQSAQALSC